MEFWILGPEKIGMMIQLMMGIKDRPHKKLPFFFYHTWHKLSYKLFNVIFCINIYFWRIQVNPITRAGSSFKRLKKRGNPKFQSKSTNFTTDWDVLGLKIRLYAFCIFLLLILDVKVQAPYQWISSLSDWDIFVYHLID